MAQAEASPSVSIYDIAFDSAVARLNQEELAVYTGREYYNYYSKRDANYSGYWLSGSGNRPGEHPFYLSGEFKKETIVYNGVKYPSIDITYDICKSEVVVLSPKQKVMCLPEGKVQKFTYSGHTFEFINIPGLSPDFYDVLYASQQTAFYAKRYKNQNELWRSGVDYYVRINDIIYPVKTKNDLLKINEERKSDVRAFIRDNKLKFRKEKEQSMTQVVTYFDSLQK